MAFKFTRETNAPVANTDAVVTFAASANKAWSITSISWSYDGSPTGGNLTVAVGGVTKFQVDITAAGPGFFGLGLGIGGEKNQAVVFTLAAGGAGVSGKLNASGKAMRAV